MFFDHMGPAVFPPGKGIAVRPHPHIGIATITYLFEGEIMHRDSLGVVQPITAGAVNLMVAGRGIVHSERQREEIKAHGTSRPIEGEFEAGDRAVVLDDLITTGDGNYLVFGGAGNDTMSGGGEADKMTGGAGNDTILTGAGSAYVRGNAGDDAHSFGGRAHRRAAGRDAVAARPARRPSRSRERRTRGGPLRGRLSLCAEASPSGTSTKAV